MDLFCWIFTGKMHAIAIEWILYGWRELKAGRHDTVLVLVFDDSEPHLGLQAEDGDVRE